jgi:circadian clock protein KaiC
VQSLAGGDRERAPTGVRGLDDLLGGGLPAGRAILVRGAAGSGKTIFALQFLAAGLTSGEPGVYVCADQKVTHLLDDALAFGWRLQDAADGGALGVLDASPYFTATRRRGWSQSGIDARQIASDLARRVREVGARRLVIDSLTSLVPLDMSPAQAQDHLRALIRSIEDNLGCTTLLTWRRNRTDPQGASDAAACLTSGIVDLSVRRDRSRDRRAFIRSLIVRKMRATEIDVCEHRFHIAAGAGILLAGGPSTVVDAKREFSGGGRLIAAVEG